MDPSLAASTYPKIAPKFQTLWATTLKLATRGTPQSIDLTRVGALRSAKMHTRTVGPGRERLHAKMAGLGRRCDVVSPRRTPTHEVFFGDEDASVVARPAARPAGEAVELAPAHRPPARNRRLNPAPSIKTS